VPNQSHLDVYGLRVAITGSWTEVIDELLLDFGWFARPGETPAADVDLVVSAEPPDFDRFAGALASFVTPRNVVYQVGGLTVVDYFGRAIAVVNRASGRTELRGEDEHLVREAAYLFLLSRIGEHLDRRQLARVHGLGLAGAQGAVVVLLPSGGGKSTLALRALRDDRVKLLSEDSPIVDHRGRVHPFPLRIGVNETDAELLPPGRVRRLERMEFHPKLVLDTGSFAERIEPEPQPIAHIVVGRRALGPGARLDRIGRGDAIGPLLREAVVGVGIYQGMEFVLQHGMRDVVGKFDIAFGRARCCAAALRRARTWRLTIGRDHEQNWEALLPLVR